MKKKVYFKEVMMLPGRPLLRVLCAVSILACPIMYGMERMEQEVSRTESKNIALSFDIDDVISGKEKVGFQNFLVLTPMFLWNPMLATAGLPENQAAIKEHVRKMETEQKVNGATNVMRGVIEYLRDNGYGDISYYEEQLNGLTQKPNPVMRMVANVEKLKKNGHPLVAATNQDFKQYKIYREYMKTQHNIDLKNMFDGVITTPVYHIEQPAGKESVYRIDENDHIYVTRKREDVKPAPSFFYAVAEVIKKIHPQATGMIHTDNKPENVQAAIEAGFKGVHFNLSAGSIRKATAEEIDNTINTWENELASVHGIDALKATE